MQNNNPICAKPTKINIIIVHIATTKGKTSPGRRLSAENRRPRSKCAYLWNYTFTLRTFFTPRRKIRRYNSALGTRHIRKLVRDFGHFGAVFVGTGFGKDKLGRQNTDVLVGLNGVVHNDEESDRRGQPLENGGAVNQTGGGMYTQVGSVIS